MEGSEKIERLVRTWMASGRDQGVEETVSVISNGQGTLLNVVKALGEYLTAEEDELRTKGVEFLSAVLARCPSESLNRQSVLVSFYCGKLEDTETVVPALKGLVSLISLPTFTSSDTIEVVKAIFAHVKMKSLIQSQRFIVLSIIDSSISRHRDALKNISKEFVPAYIALANGEKDPRNLVLCFAIDRVLLLEFDVAEYIEDLFNITFCYFPITFRPPPDDPYGISTEDLKRSLRSCLNATPSFGPLGIPLFLEKLTAGSPVTKRDTLDALDDCLPVYGSATARNFALKLWNCLRLEIFQPTDPETEQKALKTTQVLLKVIYGDEDEFEGIGKDICAECIGILKEPEKSQAKPAIKTLSAFLSTTSSVSGYTLAQVVPHLTKLFHDPDEASNRTPILMLLCDIIIAARDSTATPDSEVKLATFKDEILGVVVVGLKSEASSSSAVDGLKAMVTTKGLLVEEELGYVVHNINELLSTGWDNHNETSDAALDLLSIVAVHSPKHIESTTLPLLFSSLPDQAPSREAQSERAKYWRTLSFLAKLCEPPTLFETLVIRLTTKLDLMCGSITISETDVEPNAAYAHSILLTLRNVLRQKTALGHTDIVKYVDRLVSRLYNLFIYSALEPDGLHMIASEPRLLNTAGDVITLVIQAASVQKQEVFTNALVAAFFRNDVGDLVVGHLKVSADAKFGPFEPSAPSLQKNLAILFSAAVIALHKEVRLPVEDPAEFLSKLLLWSVHEADNVLQRDAACHTISSVVNKRPDDLARFLSQNLETFWPKEIADAAAPVATRRHAVCAWVRLSKALSIRGHPSSDKFIDSLFDVFDDAEISWDAARAIGQIAASDDILTKRNHAVSKILVAQKYCNRLLPRIIEGAKTTSDKRTQTAYLVALTSLIKSVPKTTYAHEMPILIPLLLRGLELPDPDIRASVIETLHAATEGDSNGQNMIAEHTSTLVSAMLKNSMVQEMPSIRVRLVALRYLAALPKSLRYDKLHPYKTTVIRELTKVLDDPKRTVRKEAVDARSNWFTFSG